MNKFKDDNNSTESHQRPERHGEFSSQSRMVELQRAQREALILQTQRLCASERSCTEAVLERLRVSIQQDPVPTPQPPAGVRNRPTSSVRGRRIRTVSSVAPFAVTPRETEETWRHWRSSDIQHGEIEELLQGRDQSFNRSASVCSENSFSSVDTQTPNELRAIPLIRSPVEVTPPQTPFTPSLPPPPSAPQPSRRVSRLPVMIVNLRTAADKEVAGGYSLQKAQHQIKLIQDRLQAFAPLPRPPVAPKRTPALLAPAPPLKPAPPKKARAHHRTSARPVNINSRGKKTDGTSNIQLAEMKKQEELHPLSNPVESLSLCLNLLNSADWTKKMKGLQCVQALAQHHPNTLMVKLHEVCLAVVEEVKNLRSSVACAAMDTIVCLYVHLQRDMDTEAERTGRALLLKIAKASANVFVQQQANVALEALVKSCSPGRVLPALLNTGLSHLSAAVRTSTAQQLHLLADRLGAATVLTAGQSFSQRFLTATSKMSLDAAAEVRLHGRAILQELSLHKDFMKLWQKTVGEKDRRSLEKIVRNVVKK